jgi:hypothetical protein
MSRLLQTGLDRETLAVLLPLCELGMLIARREDKFHDFCCL